MNIDVISQYCVYNDYPIFRYNTQKHRDNFRKVILYPSRHHGVIDLEGFSKKNFPQVTWVEPVPIDYGVEDWRQAETIPCLKQSDADWILFMEQDFFVKDWDKLYTMLAFNMKFYDAIGWWNETAFPYLHPCFFLIKRELFEKTQKDFSAHPEIPGCDHFAMLTRDIEKAHGKLRTLQQMGYKNWETAFHLGSLTYTYQEWKNDGTDRFGQANPEAFFVYNHYSRQVPVFHDPEYLRISKEIEIEMIKRGIKIDPENNKWVPFFKLW